MKPTPLKRRWAVVALAISAASAFAVSVQAGRWWSLDQVDIGPFGSRQCFGGDCHPAGMGWINGGDRWTRMGIATWGAGLVSMFVLVVLAGAVAAGRVPRLAARTSLVAITVATIAGGVFVAGYPGVQGAGIDRGLVLYAAAIVFGLTAAIAVLRARR